MATQKGVGVVWGIGTTNITAGAGVLRHTGENYSSDKEFIEHRGTDGEYIGCTSFAGTKTLEVELYPAGTSIANAVAANVNYPAPGDSVTLTDTDDTDIAGVWICVSFSKRKSNTDKAVGTLSLKRWNGISSYTTIT